MFNVLKEILEWQNSEPAFNAATPQSTFFHLMEEVGELCTSLNIDPDMAMGFFKRGVDKKPGPTGKELADAVHMIVAIAHVTGYNLTAECYSCLRKNMMRTWGKPDENGVVNHVKD